MVRSKMTNVTENMTDRRAAVEAGARALNDKAWVCKTDYGVAKDNWVELDVVAQEALSAAAQADPALGFTVEQMTAGLEAAFIPVADDRYEDSPALREFRSLLQRSLEARRDASEA